MENEEIRKLAKTYRIPHWRIAERMGIHPSSLSILLRHKVSAETETEILRAIEELADGKE